MEAQVQRRDPELKPLWGIPIWCHHHCYKMRLKKFSKVDQLLIIAGSAASVKITRAAFAEGWLVEWHVAQSQNEMVIGCVYFTPDDLRAAFGFSQELHELASKFIEEHGGYCGFQGRYIRWQDYLNIPCPGTGNDGDPNVSIYIDKEIENAVRELLE